MGLTSVFIVISLVWIVKGADLCTCTVSDAADCPSGCDPDYCRYINKSCDCTTYCGANQCTAGYQEIVATKCSIDDQSQPQYELLCRYYESSYVYCLQCLPEFYGPNCKGVCNCSSDQICDDGIYGTGNCIFASPKPTPEPSPQLTPEPISKGNPFPTLKPSPYLTPEPTTHIYYWPTPEPNQITAVPTVELTISQIREKTHPPIPLPTPEPTPQPTPEPTPQPTPELTPEPTPELTPEPTPEPTPQPTPEPTPQPTPETTPKKTPEPTSETNPEPTLETTPVPTPSKTKNPSSSSTPEYTPFPSLGPTATPTISPTQMPSILLSYSDSSLYEETLTETKEVYSTMLAVATAALFFSLYVHRKTVMPSYFA